jgi:[NiFe] hydrogenase large subunit
VDHAVGVEIPPLAVMIRNLILASQFLTDHVIHFYHLNALDYVDVTNCLNADVAKAAKLANDISPRRTTSESLKTVQDRVSSLIKSGQLSHFTNAYFLGGHPAYTLPPELDLIFTAHYLEALHLQVRAARAMALFGGKNPHPQFLLVGGVSCYDALRPEVIREFLDLKRQTINFIKDVYIPDLLAVAAHYKDVATYGGTSNFFTSGEFFKKDTDLESGFFKPGVIWNRDLKNVAPFDPDKTTEDVSHAWYEGKDAHHPYEGKTEPVPGEMHVDDRYTWSKAPRYDGKPMETGPLANMLVNYARGVKPVVDAVDTVLKALNVGPEFLFSTLGRTAARGIETLIIANEVEGWVAELQGQIARESRPKLVEHWTMPKSAKGVGWVTASRGALSHWIVIEDGKIDNFQLVVPTTWNMSPRDIHGAMGPFEEALTGIPIADHERPVEILRTIHSFDPCIACAVHVITPETNERRVFKIL